MENAEAALGSSEGAPAYPIGAPVDRSLLAVTRADLISHLFVAFDDDHSLTLNESEMLKFMRSRGGFRGSDQDWAKEYKCMSLEGNWSASQGINLSAFTELVSDKSNIEYHCDDEQLHDIALARVHEEMEKIEAGATCDRVQCSSCKADCEAHLMLCQNWTRVACCRT